MESELYEIALALIRLVYQGFSHIEIYIPFRFYAE